MSLEMLCQGIKDIIVLRNNIKKSTIRYDTVLERYSIENFDIIHDKWCRNFKYTSFTIQSDIERYQTLNNEPNLNN